MRYLMTFSYDGTNYSGYQKQPKKHTIQSEIEEQLKKINGNKEVIIHATGRTDAKVHANNQAAHFDLNNDIHPETLKKSLNKLLQKDIYIRKIQVVSADFHARFDLKEKEYIYKINIGEYNPADRNYIYQYNMFLDTVKMKEALLNLKGEHDFKSFAKIEADKDCVRNITDANLVEMDNTIIISIRGNGFLRYMVRNIVGILIEIGSGKKNVNDINDILTAKDRTKAGITAPPEGLYLNNIFY